MVLLNALTVDVEDWYTSSLALFGAPLSAYGQRPAETVVANTSRLLDILDQYDRKATFFILGTVAEHFPDLVGEVYRRGHEIATHGYSHRLAYTMTPEAFEDDLVKALSLTRAAARNGSLVIKGYRAPYFSLNRQHGWAFDILAKHGIQYDSSIFPVRRGLYGDPDAPTSAFVVQAESNLWEFPPSTVRILGQNVPVAGGGYLRLFPYRLTCWGIRRLNQAGIPAIVYVHPYELDPTNIEMPGNLISRRGSLTLASQVIGRRSTEGKVRRLLGDFSFGPLAQLANDGRWSG